MNEQNNRNITVNVDAKYPLTREEMKRLKGIEEIERAFDNVIKTIQFLYSIGMLDIKACQEKGKRAIANRDRALQWLILFFRNPKVIHDFPSYNETMNELLLIVNEPINDLAEGYKKDLKLGEISLIKERFGIKNPFKK